MTTINANQLAAAIQGWVAVVVDDEQDSLDVAAILLEMVGVTVYTARDGVAGLALVTQHLPDFVLSDLSMPEMSGWEMLNQLKREPATNAIPVIALTAHAMPGDRNRTLAAGFHNYLSKPLVPETFVLDVLRLLVDSPRIVQKVTGQINQE